MEREWIKSRVVGSAILIVLSTPARSSAATSSVPGAWVAQAGPVLSALSLIAVGVILGFMLRGYRMIRDLQRETLPPRGRDGRGSDSRVLRLVPEHSETLERHPALDIDVGIGLQTGEILLETEETAPRRG